MESEFGRARARAQTHTQREEEPCPPGSVRLVTLHLTDVSDSHSVALHPVCSPRARPVYVTSPMPAPCTVIDPDPVPARF